MESEKREKILVVDDEEPVTMLLQDWLTDEGYDGNSQKRKRRQDMNDKAILLVEDDSEDVILTLCAFQKGNITNEVVVVKDGAEALNWLFGTGTHAGCNTPLDPQVVLLDLKLPKVDGLEVLRRIRADDRTQLLPVVILTSSREEQDVIESYHLGGNSYICKPADFEKFADAVRQLELYWLLNELPRVGKDRTLPPRPISVESADLEGTETVLVTEDDETVRELVQLKARGMSGRDNEEVGVDGT